MIPRKFGIIIALNYILTNNLVVSLIICVMKSCDDKLIL